MRRRILEQIEDSDIVSSNGLASKMDILQALHLIFLSWKKVSDITIRNCFRHSGFSTDEKEIECISDETLQLTTEDFQNWVAIDEKIQTTAELSISEICKIVTQTEPESSSENEIEEHIKLPSASEMRQALQIIRLGVQHRSEDFNKLYEFEEFVNDLLSKPRKQTTIYDFFQK